MDKQLFENVTGLEDVISEAYTARREQISQNLLVKNKEYSEAKKICSELSDRLKNELNSEQYRLLDSYLDQQSIIVNAELEAMYFQAVFDFTAILEKGNLAVTAKTKSAFF